MSGYVCTVASGKGGVGKTTAALNLGLSFSEAGYETVVIEADLGMSDLADMVDLDVDNTIHDVLAGTATVSDASASVTDGLTVIPGDESLDAYADADPKRLQNVIETTRNSYDVVIIDTGPGLSYETTAPLGLADGIILAVTPNAVAVEDAKTTGQMAEQVDGNVVGGLLTQVHEEPDFKTIASRLGYPVLGIDPMDNHPIAKEPVVQEFPDSHRAEAYGELVEALEGVFFGETKAFAVDTVYQEEWIEEAAEAEDTPQDDDDDDYSHEVFRGI